MALSRIVQLGYVCRRDSLDDTLRYWQESAGAGPFWTLDPVAEDQVYRGEPCDAQTRVCFGYVGDFQVEIIAPLNDAPSPWTAWLADTPHPPRAGLAHHMQFEAADFDATLGDLTEGGSVIEWTAVFGGRRIAYLASDQTFGFPYLEVTQQRTPAYLAGVAAMLEQTATWDRVTDPVRPYAELFTVPTA